MKPKQLKFRDVPVSDREIAYRENTYKDVSTAIEGKNLKCTCCVNDVKHNMLMKEKIYIHPFFKVLVCKDCLKFYGDGYISPDEDGSDKYCRWCGQGGCLYLCSKCPVAICQDCVRRNMNRTIRKAVEMDDWECFSCNPEPLYELRGLAWAAKKWLKFHKKKRKKPQTPVQELTVVDTLEGQLKNGRTYMKGIIKELQKTSQSFMLKVGAISRRKYFSCEENLSFEKLSSTLQEVKGHVKTLVTQNDQQVRDLENFLNKMSTVVDDLKKNNDVNENPGAIDNKTVVCESSDNENGVDLVPSPACSSVDNNKDESSDTEKEVSDWVIQPVKTENDDCQPKFRIRKIDEVNKILLEQKANNIECEVINLDDDDVSPEQNDVCETNNVSPSGSGTLSNHQTNVSSKQTEISNRNELHGSDSDLSSNNETTDTKKKSKKVNNIDKEDSKVNKKNSDDTTNSPSVTNGPQYKMSSKSKSKSNSNKPKAIQRRKSGSKEDASSLHQPPQEVDKIKLDAKNNNSVDIFSDNDDIITAVVSSTSTDSSDESDSKKRKVSLEKKKVLRNSKGDPPSSKKKKEVNVDSDSDSDSDIEKLLNLKSLEGRRSKNNKKTDENQTLKMKKKKNEESAAKRLTQKTILDYCNEESDESVMDMQAELESVSCNFKIEDGESIIKKVRAMSHDGKLDTGSPNWDISSGSGSDADDDKLSSDLEDLLKDSDDDRISKKKSKSNASSNKDKDGKSSTWKTDKLLTIKLSDDSDSDDSTFQKKKSDRKSDKRLMKKKVLSDSEDEVKNKKTTMNSSESADSEPNDEDLSPSKKRKRIKNQSSSSGDDDESGNKGHRKNIRKVLKKDSLNVSTQSALKEEEERKKRIAERQKLYNKMMEENEIESSKVEKLVLDFDVSTKAETLSVDKDLISKLKPHQAEGIKFMWDSCFETVEKAKSSKGSGCILAHCMGLGKTLQVVTLVHTLLMNDVKVKTALVLCPLSTVLNWVNEFEKWLSEIGSGSDVDVFHLSKVNASYRASELREWQRVGGVMILGYNLFRLLVNPAKRMKASIKTAYLETLTDPGADIVICDEGHLLKNEKTALSKAVEKIKTLRRIVLTGTPLQNNLIEYHCMMQFVKPNLLGTKKEFVNRFVNPIENGQFVDSTPHDVKIMKRRAHVLHKMLDGLVQRKTYNVLTPFLPTKYEYVLSLALTDLQVKLYQYYLDNFSRNQSGTGVGTSLFKDRNMLSLICAHPRLLIVQNENEAMRRDLEESDEEGSLKDFIDDSSSQSSSESDSSSSSSNSDSDSSKSGKGTVVKRIRTRTTAPSAEEENSAGNEEEEKIGSNWWDSIAQEGDMEDIGSSCKLILFFTILQKCQDIGDKLLLFSQSLLVLDLIEYFLDKIDNESQSETLSQGLRGFNGSWVKGIDYFRLDGKTSSENRALWCKRFNSKTDDRARLFLISTRAGGLGINLTGANRVILFDASWNPSHDVQSIFRVFRFGQEKPCYIYRFLNKGTMEQKVYDRQVTKLSMSCRVIDEQQIDRHFSFADLNELYTFTPNEKDDKTPPLPKDRLLAELLQEQKDVLLYYHTHDSLLENQENEELNEEERKQAWVDFENEKTPPAPTFGSTNNFAETYHKVFLHLSQKYPTWSEDELRRGTVQVINKMNAINVQNQHANQQTQMANALFQQQYGNMMRGNLQFNPQMFNQLQRYPAANYMPANSSNPALARMPNTVVVRAPLNNAGHQYFTNPFSGGQLINPFSQSLQTLVSNRNQATPDANNASKAATSQSATPEVAPLPSNSSNPEQ